MSGSDSVAAQARIAPHVRRTPVASVEGAALGAAAVDSLWLKLEYLQHSGSFKARGATNFILTNEISSADNLKK